MSRIRKGSGCPLCGKPVSPQHRPFCSAACKDRDLLRWLSDDYRLPGPAAPPSDPEEPED